MRSRWLPPPRTPIWSPRGPTSPHRPLPATAPRTLPPRTTTPPHPQSHPHHKPRYTLDRGYAGRATTSSTTTRRTRATCRPVLPRLAASRNRSITPHHTGWPFHIPSRHHLPLLIPSSGTMPGQLSRAQRPFAVWTSWPMGMRFGTGTTSCLVSLVSRTLARESRSTYIPE